MLAVTAKVHGLTVVTRNQRHFERVPGLQVENWFPTDAASYT
jgi:predicted nucleic acid-binding protein